VARRIVYPDTPGAAPYGTVIAWKKLGDGLPGLLRCRLSTKSLWRRPRRSAVSHSRPRKKKSTGTSALRQKLTWVRQRGASAKCHEQTSAARFANTLARVLSRIPPATRASTVWAAAGPGMAASVDERLLNATAPVLSRITVRVCGRIAACRASARSMLFPSPLCLDHFCGTRQAAELPASALSVGANNLVGKETASGKTRGRFITCRYTTRHRLTLRVWRAARSAW
jgi:hypothetical protein